MHLAPESTNCVNPPRSNYLKQSFHQFCPHFRPNKNAQRCIEAQFRDKDKSFTAALRNDWVLTHLEQYGFSLFIIV